ncbi:hypothetical protein ACFLZW_05630 [Chloroflexota bacterium]
MNNNWNETFENKHVTYVLEIEDRLIVIENVPARVNTQTGERHYAPDIVERLQKMIWDQEQPARYIQTPVYQFAA